LSLSFYEFRGLKMCASGADEGHMAVFTGVFFFAGLFALVFTRRDV